MTAKNGIIAATIGALLATSAAAQSNSSEPDLAYAEYQRGRYVGAFKEAMRRVEEKRPEVDDATRRALRRRARRAEQR